MDGNGPLGQRKRFMPRSSATRPAVDALVRTVLSVRDRGVEYLDRVRVLVRELEAATEEVSGLMGLVLWRWPSTWASSLTRACGIRIVRRPAIKRSRKTAPGLGQAESSTAHNTRITLSGGVNYGGRWDNRAGLPASDQRRRSRPPSSTNALESFTSLSHAPDPDLFIRTGGRGAPSATSCSGRRRNSELVFQRVPLARVRPPIPSSMPL